MIDRAPRCTVMMDSPLRGRMVRLLARVARPAFGLRLSFRRYDQLVPRQAQTLAYVLGFTSSRERFVIRPRSRAFRALGSALPILLADAR